MRYFLIHGREISWLCRGKISESLVDWPQIGRLPAMPAVTLRNMTTIRKLVARHDTP